MTIERLNSIFLSGDRDDSLKREILNDYVAFINKWIKSELSENQKKLFHSLKMAAAPKNNDESRVIMTLEIGIHSKTFYPLGARSLLPLPLIIN